MGIKVGIKHRGAALPEAYMRLGQINGSKRNGWSGQVQVYTDKATADTNEQPITEFNVSAPVTNASAMPGMAAGGAPQEINAVGILAPVGFNPDAYNALYTKLKETYPTAVDC